MTVLELVGVTKSFGGFDALRDVSMTVAAGEVVGLVGPNGAGKSTLLQVVAGLLPATAGVVTHRDGQGRARRADAAALGAVLDGVGFHPGFTATATLHHTARLRRLPARLVADMLDEVGLAAAAEQPVGTFLLGMRQRLAIAAALLHRPALVLLDEPVNGLDPTATAWLRGLVRSWSATGTAFIVASHLLDELDRTAQRVVVLRRGAVVADAPVGELAGRGLRRSTSVVVHTDQPAVVRTALEAGGLRAMQTTPTMVRVDAPGVASVAAALSACDAAVDQIVLDRPTLAEAVDRTLAEP